MARGKSLVGPEATREREVRERAKAGSRTSFEFVFVPALLCCSFEPANASIIYEFFCS